MRTTLGQCAAWAEGKLVGDHDLPITSVYADSRLCLPGSLFVGIAGPNYDGNTFVEAAADNGAVAAMVRDKKYLGKLPGIVVEDGISALGRFAHNFRKTLEIPWVAITGSNGKTTTREILACILRTRGPVACSIRNYNNNIGVPLSILAAPNNAWAGVIELGTSAPGEIEGLVRILEPTVGIVTAIGTAHLERLRSTEGVAKEKGTLFSLLPAEGVAIYPARTPYSELLAERVKCKHILFALDEPADIFAEAIASDEAGVRFKAWGVEFEIPLLGRHNISNALAAIAAADWLGIKAADSAKALPRCQVVPGRLLVQEAGALRVIDDTYNANPDSLAAAIQVLCSLPADRHVAIIGEMAELGDDSARLHRRSGAQMARAGVDLIIAVGTETVEFSEAAATGSAGCQVQYFPTVSALLPKLANILGPGDLVLVKGSRSARMERVVSFIQQAFAFGESAK